MAEQDENLDVRIKDLMNKSQGKMMLDDDYGSGSFDIELLFRDLAVVFDETFATPYAAGTFVIRGGRLYRALVDKPAESEWIDADWERASLGAALRALELLVQTRPGTVSDGGVLTDAASIDVQNNALSTLTTAQSALTLNVNVSAGEIPNFAVEITATVAVTLTVTKTVGGTATTLKYSEAGGYELEASKTYQLTCVGSCWTVAEFVEPAAVRSSSAVSSNSDSEAAESEETPVATEE